MEVDRDVAADVAIVVDGAHTGQLTKKATLNCGEQVPIGTVAEGS